MAVEGGGGGGGGRGDPVSCTTFNQIHVSHILETKNSRISLLISLFSHASLPFLVFTRHSVLFSLFLHVTV